MLAPRAVSTQPPFLGGVANYNFALPIVVTEPVVLSLISKPFFVVACLDISASSSRTMLTRGACTYRRARPCVHASCGADRKQTARTLNQLKGITEQLQTFLILDLLLCFTACACCCCAVSIFFFFIIIIIITSLVCTLISNRLTIHNLLCDLWPCCLLRRFRLRPCVAIDLHIPLSHHA